MYNAENFARPESELSVDGIYVPTAADWEEFAASGDDVGAYDPFDDADAAAFEDDAYEELGYDRNSDYYDDQPEWMQ